jgi:hypothetical protein
METLRLRSLQNPSHVGRMLESLIAGVTLVPGTCQRVHDLDALPLRLRALVSRAVEEGRVWACWMDAHESHLFTCEMSLGQSRERGAPVLLVSRYDDHAELQESATWLSDPDGKWRKLT